MTTVVLRREIATPVGILPPGLTVDAERVWRGWNLQAIPGHTVKVRLSAAREVYPDPQVGNASVEHPTSAATECASCGREPLRPLRRGLCGGCYGRTRERQVASGRWDSGRVNADPVREHVTALNAAGVSLRRIAVLADITRDSLDGILRGRQGRPPARWVSAETARKILQVPIPESAITAAADCDKVPAIGAQRRLRALVSAGWTMAYLTEQLGMTAQNFSTFIHHQEFVTARRHRRVAELFDQLQLTPGPSSRARIYGVKHRWPQPFQWDEDTIDDPSATAACGRRQRMRVMP